MTFTPLPVNGRAGREAGPLRVSITREHVVVSIKRGLATQFGWKPGQRLQVEVGSEKDIGRIRLSPGKRGYTLSDSNGIGRAMRLFIPAWPGLPSEQHARDAEFTVIDRKEKIVEIKLPLRVIKYMIGELRP